MILYYAGSIRPEVVENRLLSYHYLNKGQNDEFSQIVNDKRGKKNEGKKNRRSGKASKRRPRSRK